MKSFAFVLTALIVLMAGPAWSAGPMGHFLLSQNTINGIQNGSIPAPPELKTALGHPEAQRAFAGGSVGPDICESASHYGNTSDLANKMIADAQTNLRAAAAEKDQTKFSKAQSDLAFAYGWLSHCGTDLNVHQYVNGMAGDTFRDNNAGEKTIHAAQEAQFTAYLRSLPEFKGDKYDTYVPYEFLSEHTGVSVANLKAGNLKIRGKAMAEIAASDQVTLTDKMTSAWGPVEKASLTDTAGFIGNPKSMGNWDLDCGEITTKEFDDLRALAIKANGGKLPPGWGKKYMDWYSKTKDLSADQKLAKLQSLITGGSNSFAGSWSTDWGAMTITVSGNTLAGRYTWDSGKVNGTVSADGRTFTGKWSESPTYAGPHDAGPVTLTLSADGNSFSGTWSYDGDPGGGGWVGTRAK
jgi:hypothetical protein